MNFSLTLVSERCSISQPAGMKPHLQVVYALNERFPSGLRYKLVLDLKEALQQHGSSLYALDLMDEFIRLVVPLKTPASAVETALEHVLSEAAPAKQYHATQTDDEALKRYIRESQRIKEINATKSSK